MLPNLIVAGTQKSGTTWLHYLLKKSRHFAASDQKEVGFFVQPDYADRIAEYEAHFPATTTARYVFESTPHYYRLPKKDEDVARRIKDTLGSPTLLVIFRDPVLRYESAYIHHAMAGRVPKVDVIHDVLDDQLMVSLGRYASITEHWLGIHDKIHFFLYDDLADKPKLTERLMGLLGVPNDVPVQKLEFDVNRKTTKAEKLGWTSLPVLGDDARRRLVELYAPEVERLGRILGRDLSHWDGRGASADD